MSEQWLQVHAFLQGSRVNGPGRRAVVHLQGCTLGCAACFNPETHSAEGGKAQTVTAVADELLRLRPDGVTISGGEPFQQAEGLGALLATLRERGCNSVLVFSGYALEELEGMGGPATQALAHVDVLVAGRFDATRRGQAGTILASLNQRVHYLSHRHLPGDADLPAGDVEIHIRPDGRVVTTGFPSPALRRGLRELGE